MWRVATISVLSSVLIGGCKPPGEITSSRRTIGGGTATAGQNVGSPPPTSQSTSQAVGNCLYITNGISAAEGSFPAIVGIWTGTSSCSGTFVGTNAVLTAAHCLTESQVNGGPPAVDMQISIGQQMTTGRRMPVTAVYFPQWAGNGNNVLGNDIAVLKVADDTAPAIMPIATSAPLLNATFQIVGYGSLLVGQNTSQGNNSELALYYGNNKVLALLDDFIFSAGETASSNGAAGENVLTSHGDSGGPLIADNRMAGIENWGTNPLTMEKFSYLQGQVAQQPSVQSYTNDQNALLGQLPTLGQIKQEVANGRQLAIEAHLNLARPAYQSWLKGLRSKGLDIRFDTDSTNNTTNTSPCPANSRP